MKFVRPYQLFENTVHKFKEGDYVHLLEDPEHNWNVFVIVKIIENIDSERLETNSSIVYYIEAIGLGNNIFRFWVDENEIERKATTEEIEEYLLKINAKKYNL